MSRSIGNIENYFNNILSTSNLMLRGAEEKREHNEARQDK